eukprot:TRINITY_DN4081_c0_g1_i1.p1 TRINITY_DN4081_c0_g1~~TRINITY_DN4081_c0_g1_i1.p1  ORF type:complete len:153 (-),score=22.20 TRINITY_DN4081_c0_g1_i1:123-581(-)
MIPDYITNISSETEDSEAFAWTTVVWMNFIPPIWSMIDVYLHQDEISKWYGIQIPKKFTIRNLKIVAQIAWVLLGCPILIMIWFVSNLPYGSIKTLIDVDSQITLGLLCVVDVVVSVGLIVFIRKVKYVNRTSLLQNDNDTRSQEISDDDDD